MPNDDLDRAAGQLAQRIVAPDADPDDIAAACADYLRAYRLDLARRLDFVDNLLGHGEDCACAYCHINAHIRAGG